MYVSKRVGLRIKQRRAELGLSQRALAKAAQLTGGYIAQLEKGDRITSDRTKFALARALRVRPEWFEGAPETAAPDDALKTIAITLQEILREMRKQGRDG